MCMFIYEYDFVYGEVEEVYKSIFLYTYKLKWYIIALNYNNTIYTSLENA